MFILIIILVNTVFIIAKAVDSDQNNSTLIYNAIDEYFLYFYTVEMFIKIFSLGFILNNDSYLRDSWNALDFFIIISGWISIFISKLFSF